MNFDYVFFDCMETLVDLHKLPTIKDYAEWAYAGSSVENMWEDFDEFFRFYNVSRKKLSAMLPEYAEYEMRGRFLHLVRSSFPDIPYEVIETTVEKLYANYWKNYKTQCYVREDVRQTLLQLSGFTKMGVVSNFMVMDGIEELLESLNIKHHFDFVLTSVSEGWKKPHPNIYMKALEISSTIPDRVVFVGDDYTNDYAAPLNLGMKAVLLDRYDQKKEIASRIKDFVELAEILDVSNK